MIEYILSFELAYQQSESPTSGCPFLAKWHKECLQIFQKPSQSFVQFINQSINDSSYFAAAQAPTEIPMLASLCQRVILKQLSLQNSSIRQKLLAFSHEKNIGEILFNHSHSFQEWLTVNSYLKLNENQKKIMNESLHNLFQQVILKKKNHELVVTHYFSSLSTLQCYQNKIQLLTLKILNSFSINQIKTLKNIFLISLVFSLNLLNYGVLQHYPKNFKTISQISFIFFLIIGLKLHQKMTSSELAKIYFQFRNTHLEKAETFWLQEIKIK